MKQHGYRGKVPKLKDRGPLCDALWNARVKLAAIDNEIEIISRLNKKDYWRYDEVKEIEQFIKHYKEKKY